MTRFLVAAAMLIFPAAAIADGWGNLGGKTDAGDYIGVTPCAHDPLACTDPPPSNGFAVYIRKKGSKSAGDYFKSQFCAFTENKSFDPIRLSCTKGDSPLAWVTYKISRNKNPNDCRYEYKYVCIKGCNRVRVPRVLLQSYWECAPNY